MCTAISFKNKNYYFGRNLDLDYDLKSNVIITPRNYTFPFKINGNFNNQYAIIGMAISINNYPLYFDAMNEKGLCMAGLKFPDFAKFHEVKKECLNITPFEFIPYILGKCTNIDEVKKEINNLNLIDIPFSSQLPNAPLHWIISDSNDNSIVVESMENGIKIYDNPYGVLTNSPPFEYHMYNMNNYLGLSANPPKNNINPKLNLKNLSEGMGSFSLPGGYSSISRFVKTVFNKWTANSLTDEISNVTQFLHMLETVSMPNGAVLTIDNKTPEITKYSCCISYPELTYYYTTYTNNQINAVSMKNANLDSKELIIIESSDQQQIKYLN